LSANRVFEHYAFKAGDAKKIKLQALEDPDLVRLWNSQEM